MEYILGGIFIAVVAFFAGKQQADNQNLALNINTDSDKRFLEAAYESGRSTQQMFVVLEVGEPYASKDVDISTVRQAQDAKARMLERNSKVASENLLSHLRRSKETRP